jgi:hypothetical protein
MTKLPYDVRGSFGFGLDDVSMEEIDTAVSSRSEEPTVVPQVDADSLSFSQFYLEYLLPNRPVVVRGATRDWGAAREWVTASGEPDTEKLKETFRGAEVCVESPTDQCRHTTTAEAYMERWQTGAFYLKDWHMARDFPREAPSKGKGSLLIWLLTPPTRLPGCRRLHHTGAVLLRLAEPLLRRSAQPDRPGSDHAPCGRPQGREQVIR